jgi:hypothetical protein
VQNAKLGIFVLYLREKITTVHAVEIDYEEMSDLSVVGMNTKEFKYQN